MHQNFYLQNAWNKYGRDNFEFSVLEEVPFENQYVKEQEYLNDYAPFPPNGYNLERKVYKGAESPHFITKLCSYCKKEFHTFSILAEICDECKKKERDAYFKRKRYRETGIADVEWLTDEEWELIKKHKEFLRMRNAKNE